MRKILFTSSFLILISVGCTYLAENKESSQQHTLKAYPESDDLVLADFVRDNTSVSERQPAAEDLQMPSDYAPGKIFSLIKEPSILKELEKRGFGLARHFEGQEFPEMSNADLIQRSRKYSSIVEVLDQDLNDLAEEEKSARGAKMVGTAMKNTYRIFNSKWFRSQISNYQLVGVINRLDRVAFDSNTCGELRFIYRLGYDQGPQGMQSRLPMTLLVKYIVEGKAAPHAEWNKCKRMVSHWTYPAKKQPQELVQWMLSDQGPLARPYLRPSQFHSVEINLQAFRIPSTARQSLGGHGSYLLRVFKPTNDGRMTAAYLENTPDVDRILATPKLHQKLKTLMKDRHVVNRIDNGIWIMPEEFLAKRAYSFSPMGLSRQDNRLFHKLLEEKDFNLEHFASGAKFVKTPDAALKRLNDLSCVGCHQGRGTAGFHFLGIDRKDNHDFNSLIFEGSGHFQLEMLRRQNYLHRVAQNLVPDPGRDFSFAPPTGKKAGSGHFCGLSGRKDFAHWQCETGFECTKVEGIAGDDSLGKCLPKTMISGSPCVSGDVTQDGQRKDVMKETKELLCAGGNPDYSCSVVKGGFPSGMCKTTCDKITSENAEVCAHIAGPNFTNCLMAGKPFEQCIEGSSTSARGLCNESISCRNDYVCGRTYGGKGNCTPSYFLFQIRLDGHPEP